MVLLFYEWNRDKIKISAAVVKDDSWHCLTCTTTHTCHVAVPVINTGTKRSTSHTSASRQVIYFSLRYLKLYQVHNVIPALTIDMLDPGFPTAQ